MEEALESKEIGIAKCLIYADVVSLINDWQLPSEGFRLVTIYQKNPELNRVLKYIDNPNVLVEEGAIDFAYNQAILEKDIKHVVILNELELQNGLVLSYLYRLVEEQVHNLIVVIAETGLEHFSKYLPIFENKRDSLTKPLMRPYFRYYVTLGEGFGKQVSKKGEILRFQYQDTVRALNMKVTNKLFKQWQINIQKIEEERIKLLNKINENAESKTSK